MLESFSPELVLVAPPHQRGEAIRALPYFEPWRPRPLAELARAAAKRPLHLLLALALAYFVVKFVWTLGYAAMIVAAAVGLTVLASLAL